MTRQISWLNAINRVKDATANLTQLDLQTLDVITDTEFEWFLALLHRTTDDIDKVKGAVSGTVLVRQRDGSRDLDLSYLRLGSNP